MPDTEQNIVAYHTMRASASLDGEVLAIRFIIKEDDKSAFHWDHTVHAADAVFDSVAGIEKGSDESGPSPTATSNGRAVQTLQSIGATRLVSCQLDSIVSLSGDVFNLFIEGELPEEIPADDDEGAPVADIDPTEPTGYALAMADEALQLKWRDRLDAFFQARLVDARNAMRELGWDGPIRGDLAKDGVHADFTFKQVGGGANVVGMTITCR
jgi:hypothetical protein